MIGAGSGIIRTKLTTPLLGKNIIARNRLDEKLSLISDYGITVIAAPAGYGKTTSAVGYLLGSGCRTAWFSIDETDNDPVSFWQYAIAAFSSANYEYAALFDGLTVSREIAQSNIISKLLLERLCKIPHETIFVMDDFHLIDNPSILASLKYMAKYLPENIRIIIISRNEMDGRLSAMLSKGRVLSIGRDDLAFDAREIAAFYKKRGITLNSKEVAQVLNSTEGWVAGLVLSSIACGKDGILRETSANAGGNRQINRLLSDEVFLMWPERVQRFLVRTSILGRFTASLCSAVTGFDDCGDLIKTLSEENSFMIPLDTGGEWYRYHHLFSEFLKTKLKMEDGEAVQSLYRSAGQWYSQHGCPQEAVDALIRGCDYEAAVAQFWAVFLPMTGRGETAKLLGWMRQIPEDVHRYSAFYCFLRSYLLGMENQIDEADCWYAKAMEAYNQGNYHMFAVDNPDMMMKLLILCRSDIAFRKMDAREIAACYEEASRFDLPPSDHGDTNAYQPSLLKTHSLFGGRMKLALETFTPIDGYMQKCHNKTIAYSHVGEAEILYERNRLDECLHKLTESLDAVLDLGYCGVTAPYFLTLGKLRRARGDTAGALKAVEELRKRLGNANVLWLYVVDVFEAGLRLEANDMEAAEELLRFSRMEVYDCISPTTEFELTTYAKYLIGTGSVDKAVILLNRLVSFAQKQNRLHSHMEVLCLLSVAYYIGKDMCSAVAALDKAIELGMEDGYTRTFLDEPRLEKILSRYINERKNGPEKKRNYAKRLYRLLANRPRLAAEAESGRGCMDKGLLTRKELQIIKLAADGCSNLEIASELGISENTVKYHSKNIYAKLNAGNRQGAINAAREAGYLENA